MASGNAISSRRAHAIKQVIKALLRRTPWRITRAQALNRFDAIDEILFQLCKRGFRPSRVIDGGANVGNFALKARRTFPHAVIHLIEPQPACFEALKRLAQQDGYFFHPVALGAQPKQTIRLTTSPDAVTTGAHITLDPTAIAADVPMATLDELVVSSLKENDTVFLKLDLQGYELEALTGAEHILGKIEVILTEVSFYAQAYEPPISTLVNFLDERGFSLYDIAALSARPRDGRARQGDFVFVHRDSALMADGQWS